MKRRVRETGMEIARARDLRPRLAMTLFLAFLVPSLTSAVTVEVGVESSVFRCLRSVEAIFWVEICRGEGI